MAKTKYVLFLIALVLLAIRLKAAYVRAAIPVGLDYEEGNILNAGLRILHGQTPYPNPGSFPYVLNPYGPVGYVFTALGIKVFGLSLFGPRLLVLIAGLGIVVLITALSRRFDVNWEIAFLPATLYICGPLVFGWFPLLRVDFWTVFLSLLGLYVFVAFPRRWYLVPGILVLALLTKLTAISAPLACVWELVVMRNVRRALAFAGITAAIVLVCLLCLPGQPGFHVFKTHPDPYSVLRFVHLYLGAIYGSVFLVFIVICAAAAGLRCNERTRLAWFYLILCSVTVISAGKLGSETNHFLEWTAAISIVTAISLAYLIKFQPSLGRPFVAGLVALIVVFAFLPDASVALKPDQSQCSAAYAFVRSFPGSRILSEDVAALVLGGKPVLVSNPFVTTQLRDSVDWSQGSIEQLVERKYFDLVILGGEVEASGSHSEEHLNEGRWTTAFISEVQKQYVVEARFQCRPNFTVVYARKE